MSDQPAGELIKSIESMSELPENWDSYGARRIDPASIRAAKEFVAWLGDFTNMPMPQVTPSPSGTVSLAWFSDDGERESMIEFRTNGELEVAVEAVTTDRDLAVVLIRRGIA